MADDVIAIVLAGGRSRRMGTLVGPAGKAALMVDGESMLARVCRAVAVAADRVIVVAATGQPLPPLPPGIETIRDTRPAAGPLAAIHDALLYAGHGPRLAAVVACDVPWLRPEVVLALVAAVRQPGVRWAVPDVGGHPQVLVSALKTDLAVEIGAALAAGRVRPRDLIDRLRLDTPAAVRLLAEGELSAVDPTLASFADVDTPAQLPAAAGDR